MRDEKRHGASGRALREAAILYASAVEEDGDFITPPGVKTWAWDALRKAALRYAREPRPEGRPRK